MRPEPHKRIPTEGNNAPLAKLGSALDGLALGGLPAGPPETEHAQQRDEPAWKPGRVVLRRERAHRGGKTVIVVDDFATHLPLVFIERVAAKLRTACGCGGTVRERRVEIQGDQVPKIRAFLQAEGFTVAGVQ